ncbi:hypothetical protein BT96DRAFT_771846, partial [Gymnopus androsaceus JB14]
LVDAEDRIFGVLGGVPLGSAGPDWENVATQAAVAIKACFDASTFAVKEQVHRRGMFSARDTGIGYGGGRQVVGMMKISGKKNAAAMKQLLCNPAIQRIVGFTNSLFKAFSNQRYSEYSDLLDDLERQHPKLKRNIPKTAFAGLTVNMGPQSFSPPHLDQGNSINGWCTSTALGSFNADKGGHIVFWNRGVRLIIRFPSGSTVLFPSGQVVHSNIPIQPHEHRYSLIQYTAGALFRW